MEPQLCGEVSGVGGFRSVKETKMLLSSADRDMRMPALFVFVPRHAAIAEGAVFSRLYGIVLIHALRHVAKI